jgi:hypothetical protein
VVFGTVRADGQARMNFSIDDGRASGSFDVPESNRSAPAHNKLFWTSAALEEASHTLSIIVDHDSNLDNKQTLFLDYFVYTTTSTTRKSVLIDDSDTRVTYSQDWEAQNDSDGSLERTQHVSTSAGSWVSLAFEGSHSYLPFFECDSLFIQGLRYHLLGRGPWHPSSSTDPRRRWHHNLRVLSHSFNRLCCLRRPTP